MYKMQNNQNGFLYSYHYFFKTNPFYSPSHIGHLSTLSQRNSMSNKAKVSVDKIGIKRKKTSY